MSRMHEDRGSRTLYQEHLDLTLGSLASAHASFSFAKMNQARGNWMEP